MWERAARLRDRREAHRHLGARALYRCDFALAVQHFERALARSGEDPFLVHRLGHSLMRNGEPDRALAVLEEGLRRFPGHPMLQVFVCEAHARAGRTAVARRLLEGMEPAPGVRGKVFACIARVHRLCGQVDRALAAAGVATRTEPDNPQGHAERARALELQGDLDGALASFRRAAECVPESLVLRAELGRLLAAMGRRSEGRSLLSAAVSGGVCDAQFILKLAQLHLEDGQWAEARLVLRNALDRGVGGNPFRMALGRCLSELRLHREARRQFEVVLEDEVASLAEREAARRALDEVGG